MLFLLAVLLFHSQHLLRIALGECPANCHSFGVRWRFVVNWTWKLFSIYRQIAPWQHQPSPDPKQWTKQQRWGCSVHPGNHLSGSNRFLTGRRNWFHLTHRCSEVFHHTWNICLHCVNCLEGKLLGCFIHAVYIVVSTVNELFLFVEKRTGTVLVQTSLWVDSSSRFHKLCLCPDFKL